MKFSLRVESETIGNHPEICCRAFCKWVMLEWKLNWWKERKSCVSSA